MNTLSKKNLLLVSLMLFSMFFGAGNLIFPPLLGQLSGSNMVLSLIGFLLSAVGLPIMAVAAVAKAGDLQSLASRVNKTFALIFTILIYLSIGPLLGIPRAGSLAFEMGVSPFLPENLSGSFLPLFIYTLVYFSIAFWLSINPGKLVDRFGKILTPTILVLIGIIFLGTLIKPIGDFSAPTLPYAEAPILKGFLDGYLTMDAIAALNFGIVIALVLKEMGITSQKSLVSNTIKAGLLAGMFLTIIYGMLSYIGASSTARFGVLENGAMTLTKAVYYLFNDSGIIILGVIFSLACLTTSVGLITSCSKYFNTLMPKISYRSFVTILSVSSMISANVGLTKILQISVPILNAIYPMAIVLIVLAFFHNFFKGYNTVYLFTMIFAAIFGILDAINQLGIKVSFLSHMPLASKGLPWVVPAILGALLGFLYSFIKESYGKSILSENIAE
ncbi:branched-chain amino acid transport system II carrier protein [Clostridium sp.]|uniref:branched-chain amino acid transport system II carrier protein n=1 Tax=Clostridium sp. TaxID=1506 RepID=UPI0034646622